MEETIEDLEIGLGGVFASDSGFLEKATVYDTCFDLSFLFVENDLLTNDKGVNISK